MSKPITESILSNETRVFLMCCDFRSFSAVAHALGITQSAVSKIIRKFEDSIGFELFIRNSRPLTLTPEAHLLHRQLRDPQKSSAQPVSGRHADGQRQCPDTKTD